MDFRISASRAEAKDDEVGLQAIRVQPMPTDMWQGEDAACDENAKRKYLALCINAFASINPDYFRLTPPASRTQNGAMVNEECKDAGVDAILYLAHYKTASVVALGAYLEALGYSSMAASEAGVRMIRSGLASASRTHYTRRGADLLTVTDSINGIVTQLDEPYPIPDDAPVSPHLWDAAALGDLETDAKGYRLVRRWVAWGVDVDEIRERIARRNDDLEIATQEAIHRKIDELNALDALG